MSCHVHDKTFGSVVLLAHHDCALSRRSLAIMHYFLRRWASRSCKTETNLEDDGRAVYQTPMLMVKPIQVWKLTIALSICAGLAVIRYFSTDGYNQLGDMTPDGGLINGNPYNRWNYSVSLFGRPQGALT